MPRRLDPFVIAGVLALLLIGASWFFSDRGRSESVGFPDAGQRQAQVEAQEPAETFEPELKWTTADGGDGRVIVPQLFAGRVHLEDPDACARARVMLAAKEVTRNPGFEARSWEEWEELARSVLSSAVESDGSFSIELPEPAADFEAGVIYVAVPEHGLAWTSASAADARHELSPRPCEPLNVEVRATSTGGEQARVVVVHAVHDESDSGEVHWLPIARTLDGGHAISIARSRGEAAVWAVADGRRSAQWRGPLDEVERIVLDLNPTFGASGTLAGLLNLDPAPSTLRVTASRADEEGHRLLGTAGVDESGAWQLATLPTDEITPIVFRLEGQGIVPEERTISAPAPESSVMVDFELASPARVVARVVDLEGQPVEGAALTEMWGEQPRVRAATVTTDEAGSAVLPESPLGDVWVEAEKEGYVGGVFGPTPIEPDTENRISLTMGRAGRISGRCTRDGEPVSTFSLRYWTGTPWHVLEKRIQDSMDGSFVLDDAPLGTVQIFAMSPDCPPTQAQTVEVAVGSDAWVEIELVSPGSAAGRVVDGATGSPIPGAEVHVIQYQSGKTIGTWGDPVVTDSLGEFEGVAVTQPLTVVEMRAQGYSSATRRTMAVPGDVFDCGTVELSRAGDLVVKLLGEGEEDFSRYIVTVESGSASQRKACGKGGVVRFEGVTLGATSLSISPPRRSSMYVDTYLVEGEDWIVEIPVVTENEVVVEVTNDTGTPLPDETWVGVGYGKGAQQSSQIYEMLDENKSATFRCVTGEEIYVTVLDNAYGFLAYRRAEIDPLGRTVVPVVLRDTSFRLRLLTPEFEPIASTRVVVQLPDQLVTLGAEPVTDENGIIRITGFEAKQISISVSLPEGRASGILVDVGSADDKPIEVIVDIDSGLEARVHDSGAPLPGSRILLRRRRDGPLELSSLTDDRGVADFGGLASGGYYLELRSPGYWPSSAEAEASSGRPRVDLETRAVGALVIRCFDASGPVHGVTFDIEFSEWGEFVSSWLQQELIETSGGTMSSDETGELVIYGIPRGSYAWTAHGLNGVLRTGQLEVVARETTELSVELEP